jgi:hypothetical protein
MAQIKKKKTIRENFQDDEDDTEDDSVLIPPLNTDINFAAILPVLTQPVIAPQTTTLTQLPEFFSWASISTNDDAETTHKKKNLISPVRNQLACGSCWAMSVAQALSDCLVVSGAIDWSPYISTTYCMSCYPYGHKSPCEGGNAAKLIRDIEKNGVRDMTCLDYSWCKSSPECNGSSITHFSANVKLFPPTCGCIVGTKKYLYSIDSGSPQFLSSDDMDLEEFRTTVKNHILRYGPVIGGYVIFRNFQNGLFAKLDINDGVYIEKVDYSYTYSSPNNIVFDDSMTTSSQIAGFHSVCIVGWGIARNIEYERGKFGDVPYWECRNTWGTRWGRNGYFRIAMYPYNKLAQLDKEIVITYQNKRQLIGGIALFKATNEPEVVKESAIPQQDLQGIDLLNEESFYAQEPRTNGGIPIPETRTQNEGWTNFSNWHIVVIIGIILLIISR